jgi:hypothetical protein
MKVKCIRRFQDQETQGTDLANGNGTYFKRMVKR